MLRAFNTAPRDSETLDRVRAWTRGRFDLTDDITVLVAEVSCQLPGCPPRETVVAFWLGDTRHQFKLFKPADAVVLDDLPPRWMKNALVAVDGMECDCC
jgi:nitrate reductase delta subunit